MAKKVLVVGASGLVGSHLMDVLQYMPNVDICGTCYKNKLPGLVKLELENYLSISNLFETFKPNVVYVPAFISSVDRCETDGYARKVNVGGIMNLVEIAEAYKTQVVFFSSAYVFDGTKNKPYSVYDTPMPIQQYGVQKLQCENKVLSIPNNVVIRTSNVIGKEFARKNFAYQVLNSIKWGKVFDAYADQLVSPIHANDLAVSTIEIVDDGFVGLAHINGDEEVSKYEFALDIASLFTEGRYSIVNGITAAEKPQVARRPYNACLKNTISTHISYGEMLGHFYDDN